MARFLQAVGIGLILTALLLAGLVAIVTFTGPAFPATMPCGKAEDMLAGFRAKYDEVPIWRGVTGAGTTVVVLASPAGTWTALQMRDGMACAVASGDKAQLADKGDPA